MERLAKMMHRHAFLSKSALKSSSVLSDQSSFPREIHGHWKPDSLDGAIPRRQHKALSHFAIPTLGMKRGGSSPKPSRASELAPFGLMAPLAAAIHGGGGGLAAPSSRCQGPAAAFA
ncbi:unnamed protein product [Lampetra planeri]